MLPHRRVYDEEHNQLRETVRRFAASKIAPDFQRWEEAGIVDRSLWSAGGTAGLLCPQVPKEFGGAGGDFRHNAVVIEELSYSGFAGPATDFSVHNDVCCGYLLSYGSPEQKKKWLPRKGRSCGGRDFGKECSPSREARFCRLSVRRTSSAWRDRDALGNTRG